MADSQTIITTCTRDCPNTCGLEAVVQDSKVVKLIGSRNHPFTKGKACHKTTDYIKRVYSPERIIFPMIKEAGEWKRVSWDQALDLIADRMKTIKRQDGAEAILYYQGYGERTALKLLNNYFFNLFGNVTTLTGSLCGGTGQASQNLDFGRRISHDPLDHYNSKAIILWGRNPAYTNISLVPILKEIRKKGGKVILIDPFKNKSAVQADLHIAPAPGKDVYLAMAAAQVIFDNGRQDTVFLENYSVNASDYKELVYKESFETLCRKADLTSAEVIELADTLINFTPTAILLGWGLHRHKNAHFAIRSIDALGAIAGNIGVQGGGVSQGFEEYGPYEQSYWGDYLHPNKRRLSMPVIGEEILNAKDPKIRMIFTTAANPVCMAPNTDKVSRAFNETEFKVYSGHFMNDTAELSDVFLPATTFLEEDDVMATYGHNYVGPVNKAIEPLGECLTDFHMFSKLAKRFDFADKFIRNDRDWLYDICAPIRNFGCSMETLRQGPFRLPEPMVPYSDMKFETSSGKYHFMTEFEPQTIERGHPDYPYTLLTVAARDFICSERTLKSHKPLPEVKLNPGEAAKKGLEDGTTVYVKSPVARIKALLKIDAAVRKDCVVAERGGWLKGGHGLNRLTSDMSSTVGNGTPYYETLVNISKEV